jgi:hypothetical protein
MSSSWRPLGIDLQTEYGILFTSPKLRGTALFTWRKLGSAFHSWIANEIGANTGASIAISPFTKIARTKLTKLAHTSCSCCRFRRDNPRRLMAKTSPPNPKLVPRQKQKKKKTPPKP